MRIGVKNGRKGQPVSFQVRTSAAGKWKTFRKAKLNSKGRASASRVFTKPGRPQFRAVVSRTKGRRGATTATRTVSITYRVYPIADKSYAFSEGTLMSRSAVGWAESGSYIYWHPSMKTFDRRSEDLVEASLPYDDDDNDDVDILGVTGSLSETRLIYRGEYFTSSSGLTPAFKTLQLLVVNPFTRKVERRITTSDTPSEDSLNLAAGDGRVFAVNTQRGDERWAVAYNLATGAESWSQRGQIPDVTSGFGHRKTVIVEDLNDNTGTGLECTHYTLVDMETGTVLRRFDDRYTDAEGHQYCSHLEESEGLYILESGGDRATDDPVYDGLTGEQLDLPSRVVDGGEAQLDRTSGIVAWEAADGSILAAHLDGSAVFTLPAAQATPVGASVVELVGTSLWVQTTSQLLRFNLLTGAYAVVKSLPAVEVTQLQDGWTFYSNGKLRQDRGR